MPQNQFLTSGKLKFKKAESIHPPLPSVKALLPVTWGLFLWLPAAVAEDPKVNHSVPIDPALLGQEPYRQTGLVLTADARGSGFVASHPNLFFTAAHMVYRPIDGATPGQTDQPVGWQPPPSWLGAYNNTSLSLGHEVLSRGYFRWTLYSDLVEKYAQNSNLAFGHDSVLVWGLAPFIAGSAAALDTQGMQKLHNGATSMITGYPAIIDYTNAAGNYFMHATTPAAIPYKIVHDRYLTADLISTGPGNSGGPVWIHNPDTTWSVAGTLVSGLAGENGVYAMSPDINSLLQAAQPLLATPLQRTRHVKNVGASTAMLALERPQAIPDGVKRWTVIPFVLNDFPDTAVVVQATLNLTIITNHRGDLVVRLLAPGGISQDLFNQQGADAHDVIIDGEILDFGGGSGGDTGTGTGTGTGSDIPTPRANGRWQLLVQDRLRGDLATVTRFELELLVD